MEAARFGQRGAALLIATLAVLLVIGALLAAAFASQRTAALRERISERSLAQAREALIAYAADRPINAIVGPGYLPCPDLDDDGWAEATCGSQSGDGGQAQRLGRLPWKTLGLPDLRDGYGERLWYAVSSKYKGLLNCGVSRACLDMSPGAALGTITLRDASGLVVHDGTVADAARADAGGAVAVVIAPGPALARLGADGIAVGEEQRRDCAPGECEPGGRCLLAPPQRSARCNPANYLDRAPGARFADEDNADFVDRNDAAGRARNGNGFIEGPVFMDDGRLAVNDRMIAITYRDVMPAIMRRVALEVAHCLRYYASRPENAGRYPWPAPACGASPASAESAGLALGLVPDTPFEAARASSGGRMLPRWWRIEARSPEILSELPTREDACRIAIAPDDAGPLRQAFPATPADEARTAGLAENAWWSAWRPFVFYVLAPGHRPALAGSAGCGDSGCLALVDGAQRVVAEDKQFAVVIARDCAAAPRCDDAPACTRVSLGERSDAYAHALASFP